ncbi:MAG: hypothetical protein HQL32_02100 [Planctomycetes bacterium]|nr:hypothetical protein [Planctomycetota bacterium]
MIKTPFLFYLYAIFILSGIQTFGASEVIEVMDLKPMGPKRAHEPGVQQLEAAPNNYVDHQKEEHDAPQKTPPPQLKSSFYPRPVLSGLPGFVLIPTLIADIDKNTTIRRLEVLSSLSRENYTGNDGYTYVDIDGNWLHQSVRYTQNWGRVLFSGELQGGVRDSEVSLTNTVGSRREYFSERSLSFNLSDFVFETSYSIPFKKLTLYGHAGVKIPISGNEDLLSSGSEDAFISLEASSQCGPGRIHGALAWSQFGNMKFSGAVPELNLKDGFTFNLGYELPVSKKLSFSMLVMGSENPFRDSSNVDVMTSDIKVLAYKIKKNITYWYDVEFDLGTGLTPSSPDHYLTFTLSLNL